MSVMSRADAWPMQLDFAHVSGACFVAYGWVAGLGSHVARARLQAGRWQCNLLADTSLVTRADVSEHLGASHPAVTGAEGQPPRHQHGFFVLADWEGGQEAAIPEGSMLRLTIQTRSGIVHERQWPVEHGADAAAEALRRHERAMRLLIGSQTPRHVQLLTGLFQPPLVLRSGDLYGSAVSHGPALQVPIAGVIHDRLILAGQLPASVSSFHSMTARWYLRHKDESRAFEADVMTVIRELPDAGPWDTADEHALAPIEPRAFIAALPCTDDVITGATELELSHQAPAGAGRQRLSLRSNTQDLQRRLSAWLKCLEPTNRVAACEHLLEILATDVPGGWRDALVGHIETCVPSLPTNIDSRAWPEQLCLYLEQAILVPDVGMLLAGWAYADGSQTLIVTYHAEGRTYPVSTRWVRCPRTDVQKHLIEQGFGQVDEPGFVCVVDFERGLPPARQSYLKVCMGRREWRVRVPTPAGAEPVRRLIRTLLATVDPQCIELRRLLDTHIGRAVQATWARRPPPRSAPQRWQFGPAPEAPTVSIVVPLFGRNDLADYQLALFTDDPDLHAAELIYVLDDPSVLHEFRPRCTDLYRMHGLPFTLAYPGDNLGFAGASNHGASLARAPLLLLLNSDVFPMQPGWLSQMVQTYRRHPDTGLLGVKLLYEDGSIQHAGMESVPFEGWQGMWINRHPHKGLHPDGLTGVHPANAVTAACAMVDVDLYRSLGGLSEDFIIGDFEDSDLCYRAREAGRPCRIDLDIGLYHLERQSQDLGDATWRTALTLYNCWVHDQRWSRVLAG